VLYSKLVAALLYVLIQRNDAGFDVDDDDGQDFHVLLDPGEQVVVDL